MASPSAPLKPTRTKTRPFASTKFDWLSVILNTWLTAGLFLDGHAHQMGWVDTFFTPWHALLYTGYMVVAATYTVRWILNIRQGYPFWTAIPAGYEMGVAGLLVIAIGSPLDLLWHTAFGFEHDLEALVSPSHLILATGLFLVVSSPLRSAWRRDKQLANLWRSMPMLLSLTMLLLILTFFSGPLHPFAQPLARASLYDENLARDDLYRTLGIAQVLIQSGFLMGILLIAIRRWQLPVGSAFIILSVSTLPLIGFFGNPGFLITAAVTGVVADLLIHYLRPSTQRILPLRVFAFVVPVVFYSGYFVVIALNGGIGWSVHFWGGAIVLSGIIGLLSSYVLVTPLGQPETDELRM